MSEPEDDIFAASGVEAPPYPAPGAVQPYRVLARKYRPTTFGELIGQEAMVQTLGNAIKRDRLAHAFLMTGVRGVGKTSTARLIAKALNCIGPDGQGGPTINPCGLCEPCRSIAEGKFIDVIEMDAASHTGVDDVREIIEAVRYASVSARYKIYIIDEVHMLSKNAFNALLKTLEEPPPHVKFIFATTEVEKVPITVLSRCQRFDLKRIPTETLAAHFTGIAAKEGVEADTDALNLIAQAAEGSVRDGLSILDQAMAHADMDVDGEGAGRISAQQIRDMLGLSDRAAVRRLFGNLVGAESEPLLAAIAEQYALGVEPLALIDGLLTLTHQVTLAKAGRVTDPTLSAEAQVEMAEWAGGLSFPVLHRLWQLLLKGHEEVRGAPDPRDACDMALLRVLSASQLPDPGELAKLLQAGGVPSGPSGAVPQAAAASDAPSGAVSSQAPRPASGAMPADIDALIHLVGEKSATLEALLMAELRLVSYDPPNVGYQAKTALTREELGRVESILREHTGMRWTFSETEGEAQPAILERREAAVRDRDAALRATPAVKAALEAFPDAEILDVTTRSA